MTFDSFQAGVMVMTLVGEFRHREARRLESSFAEALDGGAERLVVDMRTVAILGPAALRAIVKGALRARERQTGFAIVRPEPDIWQAFEITGLADQLPNARSLEEAVEAAATRAG